MLFGDRFRINITENSAGAELVVSGVPCGIDITAVDFGKDLARREMEGVTIDSEEEIDVVSGIVDEKTTGENIKFEYKKGDVVSAIILAGVLAKKMVRGGIAGKTIDIGGISTNEKNNEYIKIGIQKMIMTKDSFGGAVECFLPAWVDMNLIKADLSNLLFSIVPEIEAIQFGMGIKATKVTALSAEAYPKRVLVTFSPNKDLKYPCIAAIMDVFVEAATAIVVANKLS
ncbi:hypothetical protein [uncultured Ilyobacter sp.]|uniref:hypothetical protein n=1 Tax=uncultured Ilyobacter sp. TaxID=544433 RepID=UPI0029C85B18|nr:hypothetical protein [uncultured Ilyobacter sp.]